MEEKFTPKQEATVFPLGVFPDRLQAIVSELNRCCGFPVDYTASAMLAAISVGLGNTCLIEVKRNWQESAIIYLALVGRPGAMKSHPLNFVMQPFVEADWKANQEYQHQYANYQRAIGLSKKERIEAGFEAYPQTQMGRATLFPMFSPLPPMRVNSCLGGNIRMPNNAIGN